MMEKIAVFSLTSSKEVTSAVCKKLGIKESVAHVAHFADGEIMCKAEETVRGRDCYVIQSTSNPVTERLMELLIFVDSLKRASARSITVIVPYYGYARQDRQAAPREPITAKLVANLIEVAGAQRVIVFDLHAPQIQGYFNCPVDNLTAVNMIGQYLKNEFKNKNVVVVSPDHGGAVRARKLASLIGADGIAIFDKRRPKPNVAEICEVIGDVEDKVAVIIDDMVDTGGTVIAASNELVRRGAKKVVVCCTHAVFSNGAFEKLAEAPIERIVVTDTISNEIKSEKLVVLSIDDMLAKVIKYIQEGQSIAPLYDEYAE